MAIFWGIRNREGQLVEVHVIVVATSDRGGKVTMENFNCGGEGSRG
jgi:hypothetical protein